VERGNGCEQSGRGGQNNEGDSFQGNGFLCGGMAFLLSLEQKGRGP
jgi:hypothetical protein